MPYLSHSHLVIYIYGESYTINYTKLFPRTTKCKYMPLNVGMELPICERYGHVFPWSRPSENARAIWVPEHLCPQE